MHVWTDLVDYLVTVNSPGLVEVARGYSRMRLAFGRWGHLRTVALARLAFARWRRALTSMTRLAFALWGHALAATKAARTRPARRGSDRPASGPSGPGEPDNAKQRCPFYQI